MKHQSHILKRRNGSTLILFSIGISIVAILSSVTLTRLSLMGIKAQQKQIIQESAFYATETAATLSYIKNKDKALVPDNNEHFFLESSSSHSQSNPTVKAILAESGVATYLMEKVNSQNLRVDYRTDTTSQKRHICGQFSTKSRQPNSVCLVESGVCQVDPSNNEIATFGGSGSPWGVVSAANQHILSKHLPYPLLRGNLPILRSTGASGGANRWTSDGVIQQNALNQVCNMLGYREYVSSTCLDEERSWRYPSGKCNFHSPNNNQLQVVSVATQPSTVIGASPKFGNTWLASITCKGKLFCD